MAWACYRMLIVPFAVRLPKTTAGPDPVFTEQRDPIGLLGKANENPSNAPYSPFDDQSP